MTTTTIIMHQAVRNIREVRGFGAETRELARFQAASQGAAATSFKIGAASGRLEALNRAAIYFRYARAMSADVASCRLLVQCASPTKAYFLRHLSRSLRSRPYVGWAVAAAAVAAALTRIMKVMAND